MGDGLLFFVGTYTRPEAHVPNACGRGIHSCLVDETSGETQLLSTYEDIINPSYLHVDEDRLYAVSEMQDSGAVHSFVIGSEGKLRQEVAYQLDYTGYCHVASDANWIYASSYADGVLAIIPKSPPSKHQQIQYLHYQGTGADVIRQEASHLHQALPTRDGKFLLTVDLGGDVIGVHLVSRTAVVKLSAIRLPAGSGPRHLALHTELPLVYVWCELKPLLYTCRFDTQRGRLEVVHQTEVFDASGVALIDGAAIRVNPDSSAIVVSERRTGSLHCYSLDQQGIPQTPSVISSNVTAPRDFDFSSDGRWLLVADQDANAVRVCSLSPHFADSEGAELSVSTPVCIAM